MKDTPAPSRGYSTEKDQLMNRLRRIEGQVRGLQTMVEDDRVVSFWWNRLPGTGKDGRPIQAPGVSILHYAGDWPVRL